MRDVASLLMSGDDLPPFAREPLAKLLLGTKTKNTGRTSKRDADGTTKNQREQADAFRYFHRLHRQGVSAPKAKAMTLAAFAATFKGREHRLDDVLNRDVGNVNRILRPSGDRDDCHHPRLLVPPRKVRLSDLRQVEGLADLDPQRATGDLLASSSSGFA